MLLNTKTLALMACIVLTVACQNAAGQIKIRIMGSQVKCFEKTIKLEHVARISTDHKDLTQLIGQLDIDEFEDDQTQVVISKEQIRIRLALAGVKQSELQLEGRDQIIAISTSQTNVEGVIEHVLTKQLAERFVMPIADLQISVDPRFKPNSKLALDFSKLQINQNFSTEIPLGRQTIAITAPDQTGQTNSMMIPVSIAILREMVIAKQNIGRKQLVRADQVETVRRPVTSRSIRLASYEQVVGGSVQTDIQQYDIFRSNSVRTATADSSFVIRKNAKVNIIARRGGLAVVLKDAKALENGNLGERITLMNPTTNERILARVIDSSTVEVKY